jgi:hypothetical protein
MGALVAASVSVSSVASAEDAEKMKEPSTEEETPSRGGVWFNPLGLIVGAVGIDAGIGITEKSALNIGASYWSFDLFGVKNTSFGLGAGWQYFIIGETFGGLYVLPNVQAEYAKISFEGNSVSGLLVGPGALAGYQWDWHPFSLRLGTGFHYYLGSLEATSSDGATFSSDISGLSLDLDASIGFTW